MDKFKERAKQAAAKYADTIDGLDEPAYDGRFYDGYMTAIKEILQSPWRNVKDELPNVGQKVFIFCKHPDRVMVAKRIRIGNRESWAFLGDPSHILFWMPIPQVINKSAVFASSKMDEQPK